jgi:hypothetical protein
MTTSRSSFSIAFFMSGRRVCEFGAWPQNTMARVLSGCSGWPCLQARRRSSATPECRSRTSSACRCRRLPSSWRNARRGSRTARPRRGPSASTTLQPGRSSPAAYGRTPRSVAPCTLSWPRKMLVPPPENAHVAERQLQDAVGAGVVVAVGVLRAAHAPDHGARTVVGQRARNALELRAGNAGDALGLFRRPLGDLGADLVHAPDALADELLVFPAVLEDVPENAPDERDVRARTEADILVACAAVRVKRGSQTISGALFSSLAFRTCSSETGCASAGLPPMMKIARLLWMSL